MDELNETSVIERLSDLFLEGGLFMYPITALAVLLPLVAAALLVLTAIRGRGALTAGLVVLGLMFAGLSLASVGEALGRKNIESALAMAAPEDRTTISAAGEGELLALGIFSSAGAVLPGFLACLLIGLGLSQLDRFKAAP